MSKFEPSVTEDADSFCATAILAIKNILAKAK